MSSSYWRVGVMLYTLYRLNSKTNVPILWQRMRGTQTIHHTRKWVISIIIKGSRTCGVTMPLIRLDVMFRLLGLNDGDQLRRETLIHTRRRWWTKPSLKSVRQQSHHSASALLRLCLTRISTIFEWEHSGMWWTVIGVQRRVEPHPNSWPQAKHDPTNYRWL